MKPFHYSDYESQLMDQDYIRMLQRPRVRFFKDCKKVLDLGIRTRGLFRAPKGSRDRGSGHGSKRSNR